MIKCVIIEDEKNAQNVLLHYISQTSFIVCLGVFESGLDVPLDIINKSDFIFLDIELPELNGLQFLKTLSSPPKIIITTAYPDFAVDAFEQAVVDYIVKPFSYERFFKSVNRIRELRLKETGDSHIFIYSDKMTHKIQVNSILYVKSELDYVSIITNNEKLLVLDSLSKWESKLKEYGFIRVHRSYIVNSNRITKLSSNKIVLRNESIPVGLTYKSSIFDKLKF